MAAASTDFSAMKSDSARDSALAALGLSPDAATALSCPPCNALAAPWTDFAWYPRPSARRTTHAEEPRKSAARAGGASRAINSGSPRPPPRPARAAPLPARGAPLAPGQAAPATQCGRSARARPSRRGLPRSARGSGGGAGAAACGPALGGPDAGDCARSSAAHGRPIIGCSAGLAGRPAPRRPRLHDLPRTALPLPHRWSVKAGDLVPLRVWPPSLEAPPASGHVPQRQSRSVAELALPHGNPGAEPGRATQRFCVCQAAFFCCGQAAVQTASLYRLCDLYSSWHTAGLCLPAFLEYLDFCHVYGC